MTRGGGVDEGVQGLEGCELVGLYGGGPVEVFYGGDEVEQVGLQGGAQIGGGCVPHCFNG